MRTASPGPMPVVTAADEAFAPGLLALAKTLVVLSACHRLHVVDCGLSDTTIERLQEISPEVRLIQDLTIPPLPAPSVGSLATYARLFIVGRFQGQPRVVYLDADTVALVDPCGLHSIDLGSTD